MSTDITLGQYFPGDSFIHRLDPRIKLFLVILFIALIFTAVSAVSYLIITLLTLAVLLLTKIPIKMYVKALKPLWLIIVFVGLVNLFAYPSNPILSWWIFNISASGIISSVRMIVRMVLLLLSTSVLTYTTSPVLIAGGLERIISPLKKLHIPVYTFSMMLTIALRFIPTLTDETEKIINAQKARGADFESGSLTKRVKAVIPVIIPLFVSAIRHAYELADAMQCRCYTGMDTERTRYVKYSLGVRDLASLAVVCAALAAVIFLNNVTIFGIV